MDQRNVARSTNYLFTIGENRDVTFSAQNSNVTSVMLGQTPFPTGAKDLFIPSNKFEEEPLSIQFILSEDFREWEYIYKWMLKCKNNGNSHLEQTKPCEVTPLTAQNRESVHFVYTDCWPFQMDEITYSVQGESVVLAFNVSFRYNRFMFTDRNGNVIDQEWNKDL